MSQRKRWHGPPVPDFSEPGHAPASERPEAGAGERPAEEDAAAGSTRSRAPFLLAALTSLVLVASVSWTDVSEPARALEIPYLHGDSVVVLSDRFVCSLLGSQQSQTGVVGADGSHSVAVDGVVYWDFGDTVLANGRIIPNSIGWSSDSDASDCIDLVPKGTAAETAQLLPIDPEREQTVWPLGMAATSPDTVHFFYDSVAEVDGGSDGVAVEVAGVGLASFDTATLAAERALGGALPWPAGGPLPSRTFVDGGYVYVLMGRGAGSWASDVVLARVAAADIESMGAYEYWQPGFWVQRGRWVAGLWDAETQAWRPELREIRPLWRQDGRHNGVSVAYNEYLGTWVAVYATAFMTSINVRTAPELTGPWREPDASLIDCGAFHAAAEKGFLCYTGAQNDAYATDGGRTIYVSYSNGGSYEVYLHEIRFAGGVLEWTDADGDAAYVAAGQNPPAGFEQAGLAFYASDVPVPGLAAIHRWVAEESGAVRYGATPPSGEAAADAGIAFYAPVEAAGPGGLNERYAPVYRWSRGDAERYAALNLGHAGYDRHEIAFYAACPDSDGDSLHDCFESFLGTDAMSADSDGDRLSDDYELSMAGCNPRVFNSDDDAIPADEEILAGTNPCLPYGAAE